MAVASEERWEAELSNRYSDSEDEDAPARAAQAASDAVAAADDPMEVASPDANEGAEDKEPGERGWSTRMDEFEDDDGQRRMRTRTTTTRMTTTTTS